MQLAPEQAGFDPGRLDRITEHLNKNYVEPGKIAGCQTLVARHGHVAHFSTLGSADKERATPLREDAIFRIYSMTKPITSVALMSLYEQGFFQLNDPVSRYLPSWKDQKVFVGGDADNPELEAPAQPMTFRHVLSHTGGLTYGATNHPVDRLFRREGVNRDRNETLATFIDRLGRVPLRYQPGTAWMYSVSTDVCGALVEAISGRPFDEYLAIGTFSETAYEGTGFGLGFATTLGEVQAGSLGAGDYYWGGAASTIFWVDPIEDLICIFMTQLMPSSTFNFRGQLKSIIYSAIVN